METLWLCGAIRTLLCIHCILVSGSTNNDTIWREQTDLDVYGRGETCLKTVMTFTIPSGDASGAEITRFSFYTHYILNENSKQKHFCMCDA